MPTSITMYKSVDSVIIKSTRIARWLFFINLAPTIIAGVAIILIFDKLKLSQFESVFYWLVMSLMLSGITVQYVYYQQMTNTDHVRNPYGWLYSIVINMLFIISYAVNFFRNPSLPELMVIYPVVFLTLSIKGLRLIKHYEASHIS